MCRLHSRKQACRGRGQGQADCNHNNGYWIVRLYAMKHAAHGLTCDDSRSDPSYNTTKDVGHRLLPRSHEDDCSRLSTDSYSNCSLTRAP